MRQANRLRACVVRCAICVPQSVLSSACSRLSLSGGWGARPRAYPREDRVVSKGYGGPLARLVGERSVGGLRSANEWAAVPGMCGERMSAGAVWLPEWSFCVPKLRSAEESRGAITGTRLRPRVLAGPGLPCHQFSRDAPPLIRLAQRRNNNASERPRRFDATIDAIADNTLRYGREQGRRGGAGRVAGARRSRRLRAERAKRPSVRFSLTTGCFGSR